MEQIECSETSANINETQGNTQKLAHWIRIYISAIQHHNMNAYKGGGINSCIFKHCAWWVLMVSSALPGRLTPGEVRALVGYVWTIRSKKQKPLFPVGNKTNRTSIPQTSCPYPAIPAPHPRIITTVGNVLPFGGCSAKYAADVHRNVYRNLCKVHQTFGWF
jgi:hypothetical protein